MAVNIGDLIATLSVDVSKMNGLAEVTKQFEALGKTAQTSSTTVDDVGKKLDSAGGAASRSGKAAAESESAWSSLGSIAKLTASFMAAQVGLDSLGAAFSVLREGVLTTNAFLETSALQFETLTGSATVAQQHVRDLFDFAAATPFETGEIVQASRVLQTFGIDVTDVTTALKLTGDAAAVSGMSINEVSMWFGRAYSAIQAGRPFGEASQRLQEMGILTSGTRMEIERLSESGASSEEIWTKLRGEFERFDGSMVKLSGTWTGLVSTFWDNVNLLLADTFRPFFSEMKGGLGSIVTALQGIDVSQLQAQVAPVLTVVLNTVTSLSTAFVGLGPVVVAASTGIGAFFLAVMTGVQTVLIPLQGLIAGLSSIVQGDWSSAWGKATAAMEEQTKKAGESAGALRQLTGTVDESTAAELRAASEAQKAATVQVNAAKQVASEKKTLSIGEQKEAQFTLDQKLKFIDQELQAQLTALGLQQASRAVTNSAIRADEQTLLTEDLAMLDQRMAALTKAYDLELAQATGATAVAIQKRAEIETKFSQSFAAVTTAKLATVDKMIAADQKAEDAELQYIKNTETARLAGLEGARVATETMTRNLATIWGETTETLIADANRDAANRIAAVQELKIPNEQMSQLVAAIWKETSERIKKITADGTAWEIEHDAKIVKSKDDAAESVYKLQSDLAHDSLRLSGTTLDAQLADIDRWLIGTLDAISKMSISNQQAADLYAQAWKLAGQKKVDAVKQSEDAALAAITKTVNEAIKLGETQVEALEAQYGTQKSNLEQALHNGYISQEIYYKALTKLEEDHFLALQQARQQDLARSLAVTVAQAEAAGDYFGFFLTSLQQTAQAAGTFWTQLSGAATAVYQSMAATFADIVVAGFEGDLDGMLDAFRAFANDLLQVMSQFLAQEVVKQFVGFASASLGSLFGRGGAVGNGASGAAAGAATGGLLSGGGKSLSEFLFGSADEYTGGTSGLIGKYGEMDWRGYAAGAGILAGIGGAIYSLFKPTPTRDTTTGLTYPGIAVGPGGAAFQPFSLSGTGGDVPMGGQATAQFAAALQQSGELYTAMFNTFPQQVLEQISGSIAAANTYVQGALDEQASHGGNPVKELMEKLPDAFGDAYIGVLSDAVTLTAQGLQQELPGFYALVDDSVAGIQAQFNALIAEAQAGIEGPEFNARVAQLVAQFGDLQKLFEQAAGFVATSSEILGNLSLDTAALLETLATDAPQDAFGQFTQQLAAIDAALAAEADKVQAGVIPDLQRMTDLVVQRYTTELAFLQQIQAISEGIAQSIEAQIAGIQFAALSDEDQAAFLLDQASILYQQLAGAQTIEEVTALTGQIQSTVDSLLQMGDTLITAFGYTPESLQAMAVDLLRATEDLATSKLTDFQDAARATEDEFAAMLADVAASFGTTLDLTDAQVAGLGDQAAASAAALADLANVIGAMTTAGLEIAGVLNPAASAAAAGLSGPAFDVVGGTGESASFEGASGASGTPGVPQFHAGGYVERDTLAELAAGEVVWDAATVRAARSSQRSGRDVNLTVTVPLDGEVLARAVVTRINRRTRAGQRTFSSDASYGRNRS